MANATRTTTITNVSGAELTLGWVPPHGVTLADDAAVTIDGDIYNLLASGLRRYSRKTELQAAKDAVSGGKVTIA